MAVNLAQKYSPKVAERFSHLSFTQKATNQDYDWEGVTTVVVYSVATVTMGTYTRSGTSRYGTPSEAGTTTQSLTLSRDRAFTTTIDRRNNAEQEGVEEAGSFLARQIREVVTPEIDIYRMAALGVAAAASTSTTNAAIVAGATTSANAYANFMTLNGAISDNLVPIQGRLVFMTNAYRTALVQSGYILNSDIAQKARQSGDYGDLEGCMVICLPASYMPTSTDLIITHPDVLVSPMILASYLTHTDAPGINGWLLEGRIVYDAFALTAKINACAQHKTA
jgi:hypothetical protein